MSDKPILFSAPMVLALLAGNKTQTRRVLKHGWAPENRIVSLPDGPNAGLRVVPIAVGDRLWVREAWNMTFLSELAPGERLGRSADDCYAANNGFGCACCDGIVYRADGVKFHPEFGKALWRSPIHMPRWASRLTLTVTAVCVQRLQDISSIDCMAEGVRPDLAKAMKAAGTDDLRQRHAYHDCHVAEYRALWDSINGHGAWEKNPWVAAYTFTVQHGNINQVPS